MNSLVIVSVLVIGALAVARLVLTAVRNGRPRHRGLAWAPAVVGAMALAAIVPGQASAARNINTGIKILYFLDYWNVKKALSEKK